MSNKIETIRGVEPDYDNGGKLIDGVIIGPKISACHWKIEGEDKLYSDRREVEKELKRRELHAEIFDVLGMSRVKNPLRASEVVKIIRSRGKSLKDVLIKRKYANLID